MGLFEKLLPDSITLTEEQFKTFLEQTAAAEHGRRLLEEMTAQNAATAPAEDAGTAAQGNTRPAAKAAHTAQEDGAGGRRRRGRGAGVTELGGACSPPPPGVNI